MKIFLTILSLVSIPAMANFAETPNVKPGKQVTCDHKKPPGISKETVVGDKCIAVKPSGDKPSTTKKDH